MNSLEILNTAKRIKIVVPPGTTFVQATDSKGRKATVSLHDCNHGDNPFKDGNIVSLVAGIKTIKGNHFESIGAVDSVVDLNAPPITTVEPQNKTQENEDMKNNRMQELLAEYNQLTGKSVKRFASVADGEKRLAKAKAAAANGDTEIAAAKPSKRLATNRGEAIKATWANKGVAKARAQHDKVVADGNEYRSVKQAFEKLKLPVAKHIRFRMELKAAGHATFEGVKFKIVKGE